MLRRRPARWGLLAVAVGLFAAAGAVGSWYRAQEEGPAGADYVGRQTCIRCHQEQAKKWRGSHHDLAMDQATPETVLGDFSGETFKSDGTTSRMFRKGKKFFIRTPGPDGEPGTYRIRYTFGVEPLQQYMVAFPDGRIQVLPFAWNTRKDKWFHLYADEQIAPDDPRYWTNRLQNWNHMCADCHSTDVRKNYDAEHDTYDTTFAEIDVSCEACHGPGSKHVDWAEGSAASRWLTGDGAYGLNKIDGAKHQRQQIETCAQCHSRRRRVHPNYDAGKPFDDHYAARPLTGELYHPDGQIDEEVYVYGSFLQSKMYHKGVSCSDCHRPHSAELRASGNALCVRCHKAKKYDTPDHHFHAKGTAGSKCVSCHMPEKKYMRIDGRRDHSFGTPQPGLTKLLGVPNACNRCHDDKSVDWATQWVRRWYGPPAERKADPAYGSGYAAVFANAHPGEPSLQSLPDDWSNRLVTPKLPDGLLRLVRSPQKWPAIVRATALEYLARNPSSGGESTYDAAVSALDAETPMVRAAAVRALESAPTERLRSALLPLLDDPSRSVRTEAARVLSRLDISTLSDRRRKRFRSVLAEYRRGQRMLADQPGAHVNLATVHENLGNPQKAEAQYRAALEIDPSFIPALNNLAMLVNRQGKKAEAEKLLRRVIEQRPGMAEAHYSLGLLLAERASRGARARAPRRPIGERRLKEAAKHLKKAVELSPDDARKQYNYGLAMQKLGRTDAAEAALRKACELEPKQPDFLLALATFYRDQGRYNDAMTYARKLVSVRPGSRRARRLVKQLQAAILRN